MNKTPVEKFVMASAASRQRSRSCHSATNTQQIQLWQFFLELLTAPKMYPIISWNGCGGEFRLHQPEIVAGLWGQKKGNPNVNYEKLSRPLRMVSHLLGVISQVDCYR